MSKAIKNIQCVGEGRVTAMTSDFRMTDEQIIREIKKYEDRRTVAVYRSKEATVIVAQLYPIEPNGRIQNPYDKINKADGLPSQDDGWPEG